MHGYPLPQHVYEDLSEEFDLQKQNLDSLEVIAQMFKVNMAKASDNNQSAEGKSDLNIFNFFDKMKFDLGETPKQKLRRIVRKHFLKTARSPFMDLIRLIDSMFRLKQQYNLSSQNQALIERRTKKRKTRKTRKTFMI